MSIGMWTRASPMWKRFLSILAVLVVALIITGLGILVPVSQQDANQIDRDINQSVTNLQDQGAFALASYIFGNNLLITLLMFVPLIGPLLGLFILFNTGTILAARGIAEGYPPTLVFVSEFILPHFWLEFAAYSVAMAASAWLFMRILRGRGLHEFRKNTVLFIVISTLLLVAGAFAEVALISLFG